MDYDLTRGYKKYDTAVKNLEGILDKIKVLFDVTTYQKELDLFLEQFPEAQRNHIKYFTNQLKPTSSIEETIAVY